MRYRKAIIALFAVAAIMALTACGGGKKPDETKAPVTAAETTTAAAPETPKGAIESWGIYEEIFIPEGMKLAAGGITNAEDENAVRVLKTDNPLNYFYFILSTEEQSQKDIAATIEANGKYNPEEVTFKTGDFEWKGVGFNALGSDVAQMYAAIGDKVINVRMAGFAYNSDDAAAILGSIKVREDADTAETTEAEEVATFNVDDEAAASINALSEQIQAQDADKFKQVLEGIQEKIKGIIANNPEIAKEYIIKIQDFLKENADKIKPFVGDNETVNNTLNALTSVSADDIVSSLNSAVESISNATEDAKDGTAEKADDAKKSLKDKAKELKDKAIEKGNDAIDKAKDKTGEAIDNAANSAKKALGK